MTLRRTASVVLAGALASLAGCASGGSSDTADGPAPATCAAAPQLEGARLAAAFDSLHALATRGRPQKELVLAPHDRKPRLLNAGAVQQLLATLYPPALRDAGLGGQTEVAFLVDTRGEVSSVVLVRSSRYHDLDLATISVVKGMRFRPAAEDGCPVPYFSLVPISWTLERGR